MSEPFLLPLGYVLHTFDLLPSTMDEAARLASLNAPEGTLVIASRQTKGRGRPGKMWSSLPGNLLFSLILRPRCSLQEATALGFLLSVAIGHALVTLAPLSLHIQYKWPNDILIEGKKVAGVLLEVEPSLSHPTGTPTWIIAGIGLNLAQYPPDTSFPATSLHAKGLSVTASQFLSVFCLELQELLRLWRSQGFSPIRELWMSRVWGLYHEMAVQYGTETHTGIFEDINPTGSLVLRTPIGNQHIIATGEIMLLKGQG